MVVADAPISVELWAWKGDIPKRLHITWRRHPKRNEQVESKFDEGNWSRCQMRWWPGEERTIIEKKFQPVWIPSRVGLEQRRHVFIVEPANLLRGNRRTPCRNRYCRLCLPVATALSEYFFTDRLEVCPNLGDVFERCPARRDMVFSSVSPGKSNLALRPG